MSRYFFDITDHDRLSIDADGLDFPDLNAAVSGALRAMGEFAAEDVQRGGAWSVSTAIPEINGPYLYRASCQLTEGMVESLTL